ncbi:MAG: sporulation transcriptional regulator SpoIIID [Clostridia bacterium]|nr:sporulation transcriptional regulator SpoIIID [Clostridia bacterium]
MTGFSDDRALTIGRYIASTGATVRAAAQHFNMAKSTVHKDVTTRLAFLDAPLHEAVRNVLERNLAERHLRGGEATRRKYHSLRS